MNLTFEARPFSAYAPIEGASEAHEGTPTTFRMRPIQARILWPALGFPAVISPQPGSTSKPFDTDASRCICALIVSDSEDLRKEDAAQYLRIVPWSQRNRRRIANGQPGSFSATDIEVLSDSEERRLSMPQKDDQSDAVVFGGTADGATNPIVVGLAREVREFYRRNGLPHLYEIRVSEAASAKLPEDQYHLFWNNHAPEGASSDEMELLIGRFAKPQRRKLGTKWAGWFNFFISEYQHEYGALHPPYQQHPSQNAPLTEVLHPVFIRRYPTSVRLAHITDTHVDVRWDVYEANLKIKGKKGVPFNNCNANFTRIYADARQQSDVVLLTGDLIDYGRGHIGPDRKGHYVESLGQNDYYHEDRNWFLFYYLLASGTNYTKPAYTILGNHDWRLNPYPPFAPGAPDVWELFDSANFPGGNNELVSLLKIAHGPGHEQKYSYALETESLLRVAGKGIRAFFGDLTQDGSPVQTRIESIKWYLLLINPFLNYSFSLPSGQQLLMLDFGKDESLQNPDKPYDWLGFGPRAANCPTVLQRWLVDHFLSKPGQAKVIGIHVPPLGPYPTWTDAELLKGVKTYQRMGKDSAFRFPDGKIREITSHPMFAIRPKDQAYGIAADYGSFAQEEVRNSFILNLAPANHGIRLILSGHIHRRGLFTAVPIRRNWMLKDISYFNNIKGLPFPIYVNTTSAGPRGHEYGVQYKSMEPGWSWMSLAHDGTLANFTHVPPRHVQAQVPAVATPSHEFEYSPTRPNPLALVSGIRSHNEGQLMNNNLNFKAESFAAFPQTQSYEQPDQEQLEQEHFMHGGHGPVVVKSMFHSPHGHFGHRRHRRQNRFGSDSNQNPQSIGWAQNCLAQLTGVNGSSSGGMGPSTRRAIRMFQMQQQLPATGRLDSNTMTALQQACDQQGDGDSSEIQTWGSTPSSSLQHQVGPGPTPDSASDGHQKFELWFELNTTKLRQDHEVDSVIQLLAIIKSLSDHLQASGRAGKVVLRGFASQEGSEARNRVLSLQRAQRVKTLLVEAGIPEDRIVVIGVGPSNTWPGGLKWNRRVEIDPQP